MAELRIASGIKTTGSLAALPQELETTKLDRPILMSRSLRRWSGVLLCTKIRIIPTGGGEPALSEVERNLFFLTLGLLLPKCCQAPETDRFPLTHKRRKGK
jgi:hypothetical protein